MVYQKTSRGLSMPLSLLKGIALGWLVTVGGGVITAVLLHGEHMTERGIQPAAVIIMMLSAFAASIFAGGKDGEKRLLKCLAGGGMFYLSLLGCNALFFDGKYQGILGALLTVGGCSLVATLLLSRQKQQRAAYLKMVPKA